MLDKTSFYVSKETFFGEKYVIKTNFNHFPSLRTKTFRTFGKKISAVLSKLHSTCPNERFVELFSEINKIFHRYQYLSKKHSDLLQNYSAGSSKLHSTSPEERFHDCFPKRIRFFSSFSDYIRRKFSFFGG